MLGGFGKDNSRFGSMLIVSCSVLVLVRLLPLPLLLPLLLATGNSIEDRGDTQRGRIFIFIHAGLPLGENAIVEVVLIVLAVVVVITLVVGGTEWYL